MLVQMQKKKTKDQEEIRFVWQGEMVTLKGLQRFLLIAAS